MKKLHQFKLQNVVGILAVAACVSACTNQCDNKMLDSIESPDREVKAVLFERNCGATTPFLRIVTMVNKNNVLDFNDSEMWVMVSEGQSRFDVRWETGSKLKIVALDVTNFKMKKETFQNNSILYESGTNN